MNCELDPIASYHHHVPDSWNSSPKAHQASWESLVSECVPPLTDPHRKRGRSSRILYPLSRSSSFARPSVSFVVWTRIRVIVHPASNATHTHTHTEQRIHNSRQFDSALTNVLLPSWFQQSLTRPPKQWMPWCCDNEPRWQRSTICPSLCRGTTCRKEEGHR